MQKKQTKDDRNSDGHGELYKTSKCTEYCKQLFDLVYKTNIKQN